MVKDTAYYDLLGIKPTASVPEIRKAYRLLALQTHPDRNNNTAEATAAFQHLKAVYEILSDADRREEYDSNGAPSNLHSDDPSFDADAVAAFFTRTKKVTTDDIIAYERTYRNGEDEREDLDDFFKRMNGAVENLLDYIPYSDESDLIRFVEYWDSQILAGKLQGSEGWIKTRKNLMKRGKGKKRDLTKKASPKTNAKKRKAQEEEDGFLALAKKIKQNKEKGMAEFESWCADVEDKERKWTQEMKASRYNGDTQKSNKAPKTNSSKTRRQLKKRKSS